MGGNATEMIGQDGNFDWNQAYTGQGERDFEAPDEKVLELIDSLPPGRALDLGCGAGGLAIELACRGWQVVGVDLAEHAITSARKNAEQRAVDIEFEVADISRSTPAGAFDLITNCFALPGSPKARLSALRKAADALEPSGTLVVAEWEGPTVDFQDACSDDFWTSLDEVLFAIEGLVIESAEIISVPAHDHSRDEQHSHDCGKETAEFERSDWKAFYVRARRGA
jgi:2-polyprenyl-3-methyl-5-hydroxy-6-metoxy-1,4-benzoquinol methylase